MKRLNARTKWAALLLASTIVLGTLTAGMAGAQQNRNHWPGAGPTSRTFGVFWDFTRDQEYNTTDFTTTLVEAGSGEGDPAMGDALYGTLSVVTDENVDDATQIQSTNTCFYLTAGKHTVFTTRFTTLATITSCEYLWGLTGTDTTAIAGVANGFFLMKDDGDAYLDLKMVKSGGGTSSDYTNYAAIATLAASTAYEAVVDVMPLSSDATKAYVKVWLNGALIFNRTCTTDVPNAVVLAPIAAARNKTDTVTTTGFTLDYLGAAQDR